jgi:hypothetical protein
MAPRAARPAALGDQAGTKLTPIEMRLGGGMLGLNRLMMTFMNKRIPVASFTAGRDGRRDGTFRVTVLLDCPEETARRYATLLAGLEDVEEIGASEETLEVALLDVADGDDLRESAGQAGINIHEDGGTVVASGAPESMESWLGTFGEEKDIVRLGPVVRPGDGG